MGILDNVFGGAAGVSALLHETLGGSATIRVKASTKDKATGIVSLATVAEYAAPFVPATISKAKTPETGANLTANRPPVETLAGTFPCASVDGAKLLAERDSIVYGGVEYVIESIETLNVGDEPVQYSITARRA